MRLISALFTFWLSEAVHGKGAERFRLFKSLDLISIIIYSTIFWCDGFCWGPFWQFYVPFRIVFWSLYFQFSKPCPHFQATFFYTVFWRYCSKNIYFFVIHVISYDCSTCCFSCAPNLICTKDIRYFAQNFHLCNKIVRVCEFNKNFSMCQCEYAIYRNIFATS